MKCILDTNILLSALIRNAATRKVLIESGWKFFYPEIALHEIRKYEELVIKKSGMSPNDYTKLIQILLTYITLIPDNIIIIKHLQEAKQVRASIDPDDVVFIAAGLGTRNSIIWTDDTDFKQQNNVRSLTSPQIITLFNQQRTTSKQHQRHRP
ncbi:hypothetical protein K9M74_00990 [Candidatus Woesearchaeota archaeon]|nr:hypothetical protein [Candidatus Woesearchaeota archaeon]